MSASEGMCPCGDGTVTVEHMQVHVVDLRERFDADAISYSCPICGPGWERGEMWQHNDAGRRGAPAGLYAHLLSDHGLSPAAGAHDALLSRIGPDRDLDDGVLTPADSALVAEVRRWQAENSTADNPIQRMSTCALIAYSGIRAVEQFSASVPTPWRQLITFDTAVAAQASENGFVASWVLEQLDSEDWVLDGPGATPGTLRNSMRALANQVDGVRADNTDDWKHSAQVARFKAGLPGVEEPADLAPAAAAAGGGCLIALASITIVALRLGIGRLTDRPGRT